MVSSKAQCAARAKLARNARKNARVQHQQQRIAKSTAVAPPARKPTPPPPTKAQIKVRNMYIDVRRKLGGAISLLTIVQDTPLELAAKALVADYLPVFFDAAYLKRTITRMWPWLFTTYNDRTLFFDANEHVEKYSAMLKTHSFCAVQNSVSEFIDAVHVTYNIHGPVCRTHRKLCDSPIVEDDVALIHKIRIELSRFHVCAHGCESRLLSFAIDPKRALRYPGPADLPHTRAVREWVARNVMSMLKISKVNVELVYLDDIRGCVFHRKV